jgi:EmrB/QacA subfamily drug resistance transporter
MDETEGVSDETGRWVLFATVLASSMVFIDGSALNVALPVLQRDLGANGTELLWIVNSYALLLAALILQGGSLGDHYGRKRVFMAGIGLFAVASFCCGIAPTTGFLIAARAVQGVGGALMVPGSLALISASFSPQQRGRAIGTWGAFSTLTTVGGPIIGGFLASAGLWRGVFFINLPLAVLALAALVAKVPESRDTSLSGALDWPGAILATVGLAGITYGFLEASRLGWTDPLILGGLGGGALALIAFVVVEARSTYALVPLRLFRSRMFSGTNLMTWFLYGALGGALVFFPLNLVQVQGYDPAIAGFAFLPFALLLTALSRWAGGLIDRRGARLPLTVGPGIVGFGFLALAQPGLTGGPVDYWTSYFPGVVLLGVGMGITVAPLTTAVMGAVSAQHAGVASGVNNAVARAAGVIAVAVLGTVALLSFRGALDARTAALALPAPARAALQQEAAKLGDAAVPPGLPPPQAAAVTDAIKWAFVDTFRLIVTLAAGLAWLSALLAALILQPGRAGMVPAAEPG